MDWALVNARAAAPRRRRRPARRGWRSRAPCPARLRPGRVRLPAPITGIESPTKSAISSSDVIATRSSGAARFEHEPGRPLEDGARARADQAAADQEQREARRREAHGGHEQHETDEHRDRAEREHARRPQPAVASCDTTPAENTRNSVAPASACDGWWNVVARNSPDSPAKSPLAAKAARVAAPAGTGSLTENGARVWPPAQPVSGAAARPTSATAPSAIQTR